MANAHHRYHGQHHASSSKGPRNRTNTNAPLPPVPPAQPSLLQAAPPPARSTDAAQNLAAKSDLDDWGTYRGDNHGNVSDSSFGFGQLLFRQVSADATIDKEPSPPPPLTGRDLVEMDRLMRNDPVSFNPLQAISWAKVDEDVVSVKEATVTSKGKGKERDNDKGRPGDRRDEFVAANCAGGHDARQSGSGQGSSASSTVARRHLRHQQQVERTPSPITNMAQTKNVTSGGGDRGAYTAGPWPYHQQTEPTPSPVNHIAQTFSDKDMTSSFVSSPSSTLSRSGTLAHGPGAHGRQQRKHRHRQEKKSDTSPTEAYQQQQGYTPPFSNTNQRGPQHPCPSQLQFQVAYTTYQPQEAPPAQHELGQLLLCLGPSCQARFPSESGLNAHYQAVHTPSHDHSYNNKQLYPTSDLSHTCSWSSCNAAGFTSNNALVWHVKAEHLLLCPVPGCCDRVFASRKQLDGHMRNRVV